MPIQKGAGRAAVQRKSPAGARALQAHKAVRFTRGFGLRPLFLRQGGIGCRAVPFYGIICPLGEARRKRRMRLVEQLPHP